PRRPARALRRATALRRGRQRRAARARRGRRALAGRRRFSRDVDDGAGEQRRRERGRAARGAGGRETSRDLGGLPRGGRDPGRRADYAYAWSKVAITAGAEVDFAGRTLPTATERLVSGYGRAAIQLRLPLGPAMLRIGAGGRAGYLAQRVEPRTGATTSDGAL